jgi:fatty acid desaturase
MMRFVPWFTLAGAAVFAISPLGHEVVHSSFYSGEQLSRTLGQFVLAIVASITLALALIEIAARNYIRKRRNKQVAGG